MCSRNTQSIIAIFLVIFLIIFSFLFVLIHANNINNTNTEYIITLFLSVCISLGLTYTLVEDFHLVYINEYVEKRETIK